MKKFLLLFAVLATALSAKAGWTFYADITATGYTGDVYVHIYGGEDSKGWYSSYKGEHLGGNVYKFSVGEWGGLEEIRFSTSSNLNISNNDYGGLKDGKVNGNYTTSSTDNNWKCVNNRCYVLNSDNGSSKVIDDYTYTPPTPDPEKTYTVYAYSNQEAYKDENPNAYVWDATGSYFVSWPGAVMTSTGKYIVDNGVKYPVYSYTFTTTKVPTGIIVSYNGGSNQTDNSTFVDGAIYCYTGSKVSVTGKTDFTLVDEDEEIVDNREYIYFNAGADYYFNDAWKNVREAETSNATDDRGFYVHFYTEYTDARGAITTVKMENVPGAETKLYRAAIPQGTYAGVWFTTCKNAERKSASDKSFAVYDPAFVDNNDNNWQYDRNNWKKYIYGPGNDNKCYQSYATYADYVEMVANKGTDGLFFIGSGVVGASWDRANLVQAGKSEGVYIFALGTANNDAQFKVSYMNPSKVSADSDKSERWWATFNLGIVGCPLEYYLANNNKQTMTVNYGANNNDVVYPALMTVPYNHYNQYNWFIKQGSQLWFVCDTKYGTVCLTDFDPQPVFSDVKAAGVEKVTVNGNLLATLEGSEDAGDIQILEANKVTATAYYLPADATETFKNENSRSYNIFYGDDEIGSFDINSNNKQKLAIEGLVAGKDVVVKARALYTSNKYFDKDGNNLRFRSLTSEAAVQNDVTLAAPTLGNQTNNQLYKADSDSYASEMWDGYAEIGYELVSDYVVLPGFGEARLAVANDFGSIGTKRNEKYVAHTPYTSGEFTEANNWAKKSLNAVEGETNGLLPLCFDKKFTDDEVANGSNTLSANFTVYACYPFLINTKGITVTDEGSRNAPAMRRAATEVNGDYTIAVVSVPATGTAEFNRANLSGIADVAVDAAEAEYFNLQGVRMQGELTPGVYICRQGNKVSKVLVK